MDWLTNIKSNVSCHYLIARDGKIYQLVADDREAYHAGESELHGEHNVNVFSIGIELVDQSDKNDPYPDAQMEALFQVCEELCSTHRISLNRVVGHQHIAFGRKSDPGPDFPWFEFLATLGARIGDREIKHDD